MKFVIGLLQTPYINELKGDRKDVRVAMANADCHDSAKEIQESAAILIKEPLHVTLDGHDGFSVEGQDTWNQVFLSDAHRFLVTDTLEMRW